MPAARHDYDSTIIVVVLELEPGDGFAARLSKLTGAKRVLGIVFGGLPFLR